jgi:hypothetical protein
MGGFRTDDLGDAHGRRWNAFEDLCRRHFTGEVTQDVFDQACEEMTGFIPGGRSALDGIVEKLRSSAVTEDKKPLQR